MFWLYAIVVLVLACLVMLYPLLGRNSAWRPAGFILLLAIPALALWLYSQVGTPRAIDTQRSPHPERPVANQQDAAMDMRSMIARLQARLAQEPEDLEGWILLSRSFKSIQQPVKAMEALESARRIAPDDPAILAELAEVRMMMTPAGQADAEAVSLLEKALEKDPDQQKALWLMGNSAAQAGDDEKAIAYWESLLALLEPDRTIAITVSKQISEARARLGLDVSESSGNSPATASATGINVSISSDKGLTGDFPGTAVLYVIVRPAGSASGPPLGVRRVDSPLLPLELSLTDRDSMMSSRKISSVDSLTIQARVSLGGTPQATSGDWQSRVVSVNWGEAGSVELVLNQQVD